MSTQVDERVVQMTFDNEQFEKGIKTTMSSLKLFENTIQRMPGVSAGLSKLQGAVKNFSFHGLSDGVDQVTAKFNVMDMVAAQVLANMVTNAINTGKKMAASLSVDQISAGWTKYEDKTTSVQTILAATGKSMDVVSAQLERLNHFTDETSYNFVDMVGNIGKFTSNNIDLEDSVTAMQGIATWAAISGANASEASRAMYNLSQALSTGAVTLMDWKSIENANMATAQFKKNVLEIAASHGVLKKAADGTYRTLKGTEVTVEKFNASLSEKWFNKDILMDALDLYGGFANKLFDMMEGIEDEAPELVSQILNDIDAVVNGKDAEIVAKGLPEYAKMLKELSKEEYELGRKAFKAAQEAKTFTEALDATKDAVSTGWMNSFEYIFGNYEEAKQLWSDVAEELYNVFAASGEARNEMLRTWKEIGGRTKLLKNLAKSYTIVKKAIERFKKAIGKTLFPEFYAKDFDSGKWFKKVTDSFGKGAKKVAKVFKSILSFVTPFIQIALISIKNILGVIIPFISKAAKLFGSAFKIGAKGFSAAINGFKALIGWISAFTSKFKISKKLLKGFAKAGEFLGKMFTAVINTIAPLVKFVYRIISRVAKAISEVLSTDEMTEKFAKAGEILEKIFTTALDAIVPVVKFIYRVIKQVATAISQVVTIPTFEVISDSVLKFFEWAKAIVLTKDRAKDLRRILRGLLSIFELARMAIGKIFSILKPVFTVAFTFLGKIAGKAVHFLGIIGQLIREFEKFVKGQKNSKKFLESVFGEKITKKILKVKKALKKIKMPKFEFDPGKIAEGILDAFKNLAENIKNLFNFGDDGFNFDSLFGNISDSIWQFIGDIQNAAGENSNLADVLEKVKQKLEALGGAFEDSSTFVGAFWQNLKKVADFVSGIALAIYGFGKKVYETLRKHLDFSGFFKDLWKNLKKLRDELHKVKESGKPFKESIEAIASAIGEFFGSVGSSASGRFDVSGLVSAIQNGASLLWESFKTIITGKQDATIVDVIATFFDTIKSSIGAFFGSLFDDVDEGSVDTKKSKTLIDLIKKIFEPITEFLKSSDKDSETVEKNTTSLVGAFIQGIKNALGQLDLGTVKKVGVFAAVAYMVLQTLNVMKSLSRSTTAIGSLVESFADISAGLGKAMVAAKRYLDAQVFLTIAKGILLIAVSMFALAQVPSDQLLRTAICISIVLGVVALLILAINELTKYRGDKNSITGLSTLTEALAEFGEGIVDTVSKFAKIVGMGFVFIAIGVAILLIVKTFSSLLKLEEFVKANARKIIAALGVIALIMVMLGAVVVAMSHLTKEGNIGIGTALTIIAFAAAVYLIGKTLMSLVGIRWTSLFKATAAILGVILALGLGASALAGVGASGALSIIAMAIALNMLIKPLKIISNEIKPDALWDAVEAIALLMVGIGIASRLMGNIQSTGLAVSIIALAVGIKVLVSALQSMAEFNDFDSLWRAYDVLLAVVGAMTGFVVVMAIVSYFAPLLSPVLIGLAGVLLGVAAVFMAFGTGIAMAGDKLPQFADGLIYLAKAIVDNSGYVLGAIFTLGLGIASVITMISIRVGLAWVGMAIGLVATIIAVLSQMEPEAREKLINLIGTLLWNVVKGLVDIVGDAIMAFFLSIGYLVVAGLHTLVQLIRGLVKDFLEVIREIAIGATAGIPNPVSDFIEGLIDGVEGAVDKADKDFAKFDEIFYDAFSDNWVLSAFRGFGRDTEEAAEETATQITQSAETINDANQKAFNALQRRNHREDTSLIPLGGDYYGGQKLADDANRTAQQVTDAGQQLSDAANQYMNGYGDLLGGFDESLYSFDTATSDMSEITDSVEGSVTDIYNDLVNSADIAGTVNESLGSMTQYVEGFSAESFGDIFQGIPDSYELTDWSKLQKQLEEDLDSSVIQTGRDTLQVNSPSKVFQEIFQGVPEAMDEVDWSGAKESISSGITQLVDTANETWDDLGAESVPFDAMHSRLQDIVQDVQEAQSSLDDMRNSYAIIESSHADFDWAAEISKASFEKAVTAPERVDWTAGDAAIASGVQHMSDTTKNSFAAADLANTVTTAMSEAVSSAGATFETSDTSQFATAGANVYVAYAGGITKKSIEMKAELSKAMLAAIKGANGYIDRFRILGQQAGVGFINGMRSKLKASAEAGAAIAKAAMNAVQNTQDSHSPSRVTRKFGTFFSQGYINGILSLRSSVASAAADVGYAALNGTASQMAKISSILDSGVDIQPVISPVMDLSNIHNGVNSITGLMGQTYELANVNARMSAEREYSSLNDIATILNGLDFNSDNTDVVAAVNSLSADIANLGLAIQSMKIQLGNKTVGVINSGLGQRQMMQNRGVSNG